MTANKNKSRKTGLGAMEIFSSSPKSPTVTAKKKHPNGRTGERPTTRTPERVTARTDERTTARPGDRKIIRHSFNIYQDHLDRLKEMEKDALIRGEKFSKSEHVREAFDDYFRKIKR